MSTKNTKKTDPIEKLNRDASRKARGAKKSTGKTLLDPDSWFIENEDGTKKFVSHLVAVDVLKVHPDLITEYVSGQGTPSMFTGMNWIRDGEGLIKSELEATGVISPAQIRQAIESLCNMTRVTDPKKIGLALDAVKPLPMHTIPIESGLINLQTKEVTPHTPDYYYTEYLPRNYIPGAEPKVFIKLLDTMFKGDEKGHLKKTQIFEIIAWTLMKNYNLQGAVVLYGQGGEGKSILHAVIENLLVHTSTVTLEELETDKYKRPMLYGSYANVISETTINIIGSTWFKRVTDGTQITVEEKNAHPFKMVSHAKLIIDTNELPNMENETRAFYRRVPVVIDFPTMLESVMTPSEINETAQKLTEPGELDAIFSYVIDNYYTPLTQRMKFTEQLNIEDAKKVWEERSNPALAYLRLRNDAGDILTDIEDAKAAIREAGKDQGRYVTVAKDKFEESLVTPKQEVITDAVKWATDKGFPTKGINAGALGKALNALGYPNLTVNKKVGNTVPVKAWNEILITTWNPVAVTVAVTVADSEKHPLPQKTQTGNGGDSWGSTNSPITPLSAHGSDSIEHRDTAATPEGSSLGNSEKNAVSGKNDQPLPQTATDNADSQAEPVKSDAQSSDAKNGISDTVTVSPSENGTFRPNGSMTLKEAVELRKHLVDLGFHPDPRGCNESIDHKTYHIELAGPSDSERLSQIEAIMSDAHFTKVKEKTIGMIAFEISLRRDQE